MRQAVLFLCFGCLVVNAEVGGLVSNLIATTEASWGKNVSQYGSATECVSFGDSLSEDDCRALCAWYRRLVSASIPTNDAEYVRWSDIKGVTLQLFSIAPGVDDSTNIWFEVADARKALSDTCPPSVVPPTNVVVVFSTNMMTMADLCARREKSNRDAASRSLIAAMDFCLEDFLRSRTYRSLSEPERSSIRSNLLQRAGITEAEAAEMDL